MVSLLGGVIKQFGGRLRRTEANGKLRREVHAQIRKIFKDEPRSLTDELRHLADHYEALQAHERLIDRDLKRVASNNEVCRRFMEIPGVGPICALNFYAAVGDPHRFLRASDIGNYFGLTPRLYQSGLTSRMGRISKMGNKAVRALLVQAAIGFLHHGKTDSDLRAWALDVERRRGKIRSRVALARKLAVVMIAIWKNGERYDPHHKAMRIDGASPR